MSPSCSPRDVLRGAAVSYSSAGGSLAGRTIRTNRVFSIQRIWRVLLHEALAERALARRTARGSARLNGAITVEDPPHGHRERLGCERLAQLRDRGLGGGGVEDLVGS